MLIARAPVRISLAGGGTDFEAYYAKYGGLVISATINKYFYTIITSGSPDGLQIISSDYRSFQLLKSSERLIWDGDLALPKAVLHELEVSRGINLFVASEVPPGTGLGSSSSAAVSIIKAVSTLLGRPMTPAEIADLACRIEIEKMGMPIGRQDQYAVSFGGVNILWFDAGGVQVSRLGLPQSELRRLETWLMLFFTGVSRVSSDILRSQQRASDQGERDVIRRLHGIKGIAEAMVGDLRRGDFATVGELMHRAWELKRGLAPGISNSAIDECYLAALEAGAKGGKITGAGGGGFLLIVCEPSRQERVVAAMEARGLKRMEFSFEFRGAQTVMNTLRVSPDWMPPDFIGRKETEASERSPALAS